VLRLQAYVLLRDGDVAGAVAALRASDGYFKAASNRLEQGRTALALARALHRGGDASGSREQLALARAIFEKIGARLDLQQAQPEE
jgi:hypothetical protein